MIIGTLMHPMTIPAIPPADRPEQQHSGFVNVKTSTIAMYTAHPIPPNAKYQPNFTPLRATHTMTRIVQIRRSTPGTEPRTAAAIFAGSMLQASLHDVHPVDTFHCALA